jgi:hypothetical protein
MHAAFPNRSPTSIARHEQCRLRLCNVSIEILLKVDHLIVINRLNPGRYAASTRGWLHVLGMQLVTQLCVGPRS